MRTSDNKLVDVTFPKSVAKQLEQIWNPSGEDKNEVATPEQVATMKPSMTPEEMQTIVYSVGKIHYSKERLREWFKMIYEVLFGEEQGPRMGSFISFYGIKETVSLINNSISD